MFARCSLLLAMVATCATANPATFSQNQGGLTGNSSVIDANGGGDYLSLSDAAADFNSFAGGAAGDYTFYIASDLEEANDSAFGNATNGYTVALRPLAAPRRVTFLANPPLGWARSAGHLTIGSNDALTTITLSLVKTDRFVIDGALADGSIGLTLTAAPTLTWPARVTVLVAGDSDGFSLLNCRIENDQPGADDGSAAVHLLSFTPACPDGARISNCIIHAPQPNATGIATSEGPAAPNYQRGSEFTSNTIVAGCYGMRLADTGDAIIDRNFIDMANSTRAGAGLFYSVTDGRSSAGVTLQITRNHVQMVGPESVAVLGMFARGIDVYHYPSSGGDYTIANNQVAIALPYLHLYGPVVAGLSLTGFSGDRAQVAHNTVQVSSLSNRRAIPQYACGLAVAMIPPASASVNNNVVRMDVRGGSALYTSERHLPHCDGNVWSTTTTAFAVAALNSSETEVVYYQTLADWQTSSGKDLNSQDFDPHPYWRSSTDLHLASRPPEMLPGIISPVGAMLDDIDCEPRHILAPYRGCDELPESLVPTADGPDLSARWIAVSETPRRFHGRQGYQLFAVLEVRNEGNAAASKSTLQVLTSDDALLDAGDPLAPEFRIGSIPVGRYLRRYISLFRPEPLQQSSLIGIVDVDSTSGDIDPSNNVAVSSPLKP